jgi:hypothetical protein
VLVVCDGSCVETGGMRDDQQVHGANAKTSLMVFVPAFWKINLPCQALMALVNVNLLPKGSATDMSLVPQGIFSIPGRAYL